MARNKSERLPAWALEYHRLLLDMKAACEEEGGDFSNTSYDRHKGPKSAQAISAFNAFRLTKDAPPRTVEFIDDAFGQKMKTPGSWQRYLDLWEEAMSRAQK
jgi:hypothetical protein